MSRWLGPLAGLAIGAGLASLFLNNGLGGALAGILLAAALAFGIFLLFRLLMRGRAQPAPLRYAGAAPVRRSRAKCPREPVEPVLQRTSARCAAFGRRYHCSGACLRRLPAGPASTKRSSCATRG